MIVLILLALIQLFLSLIILGVLDELDQRARHEAATSQDAISMVELQTIRALLEAGAAAARVESRPGSSP